MKLVTLVATILLFVGIFLILKRRLRGSANGTQRFWVFYAGPENYLDESGERQYRGKIFWSCEPQTRKGDLILLYRKSINRLTISDLSQRFKMAKEVAQEIKQRRVGKDISALWQAVSDSKRRFWWKWPYGCYVQELQKLNPPIGLEELKAAPGLKKWKALSWNFQAEGRSALEIPSSAWEIISELIERRCGFQINQHQQGSSGTSHGTKT